MTDRKYLPGAHLIKAFYDYPLEKTRDDQPRFSKLSDKIVDGPDISALH
jgi:hypothetical protein